MPRQADMSFTIICRRLSRLKTGVLQSYRLYDSWSYRTIDLFFSPIRLHLQLRSAQQDIGREARGDRQNPQVVRTVQTVQAVQVVQTDWSGQRVQVAQFCSNDKGIEKRMSPNPGPNPVYFRWR